MERLSSPLLKDRRGNLTSRGRQVKELVLVDHIIKNHFTPTVPFYMSPEYVEKQLDIKKKLESKLGISKKRKKRERQIYKAREALMKAGIQYWVQ